MNQADNESNAVRAISLVERAQSKYTAEHQSRFATNFDELVKMSNLGKEFSGNKIAVRGYVFEMKAEESNNERSSFFSITADPQNPNDLFGNSQRHFYYDSTLRAIKGTKENRQANPSDSSI